MLKKLALTEQVKEEDKLCDTGDYLVLISNNTAGGNKY